MFINFGYNDPNVDISGVEFESVNAVDVTDAIPGIDRTKWVLPRFYDLNQSRIFHKTNFRILVLRHREYNSDITEVSKIDLQGRHYDKTEASGLGSFSYQTHKFNIRWFRTWVSAPDRWRLNLDL